ncbi:MAG: hypothetical protein KAR35_07605 [Candidatus Heimdallarchaeota archaeon]|nr:hypothetical protein [Candidatus Heimdallarchaeota archaeon]MCK5049226.1 hypothetical protein [Candidatus Heimdallarchaeota archaeon]
MSEESPLPSLIDELEQIHEIVSRDSERSLSPTQLSILLKNRVLSIESYITDLYESNSYKEALLEEKIEQLISVITQISLVLVHKPENTPIFSWYELISLKISLIAKILDLLTSQCLVIPSKSSFMSDLLVEMPLYDITSLMVDKHHPEHLRRLKKALTLLNHTSVLYSSACASLYDVSFPNLLEITSKTLQSQSAFITLVNQTWDLNYLYRLIKQEDSSQLFSYLSFFASVLLGINDVIFTTMLFQSRLGNQWPPISSSLTFISTETEESLLTSLEDLAQILDGYASDFNSLIGRVDSSSEKSLYDLPLVRLSLETTKQLRLVIAGQRAIQNILKGDTIIGMEQLVTVYRGIFILLEEEKDNLFDHSFLVHPMAESYILSFKHFLYFVTAYALETNNITVFKEFKDSLGVFMSEEGIERYPLLYSLFLAALLTYCNTKNSLDAGLKTANKLIEFSEKITYRPRDYFSLNLMGQLTLVGMEKTLPAEFIERIEALLSEIEDQVDSDWLKEATDYSDELKQAIRGIDPEYPEARVSHHSPFDIFSFLKPLFGEWPKEKSKKIKYLPFNLGKDYVNY